MAASTYPERPRALVVACGALGRELVALKESTGWDALDITCLPAIWHNHPEKIAPGLRRKLLEAMSRCLLLMVIAAVAVRSTR